MAACQGHLGGLALGVVYKETEAKSLMRRFKSVDDWFWVDNTMNLYRGCEHACNYCDGRSHRYHVHEDYDTEILVKVNAPGLLRRELKRAGLSPKGERDMTLADFGGKGLGKRTTAPKFVVAVGGGVSDSYQPAERRFGITRKVLEVLRDFEMPISIITKSDLVLRDAGLLQEINEGAYANVSFTVTTMDERVLKNFEPRASPSQDRLAALAELRDRGIHGGVMLMPIIPGVADRQEDMDEVVRGAKASKAEFVLYGSMSMREEQRDRVFELLECDYPELVESYQRWYQDGIWPSEDYSRRVYLAAHEVCRRNSMPERIPRHVPEGAVENNLRTCEVLCNMAYFMRLKGVHADKVKAYQRAGKAIDRLEEDVRVVHDEDRLLRVQGIGRVIARNVSLILRTGTCPEFEELKK